MAGLEKSLGLGEDLFPIVLDIDDSVLLWLYISIYTLLYVD